jgi:hypothetical protein
MSNLNESVARDGAEGDMIRALRFAGKFLLALLGVIVGLRLVGMSFAFSRWTGILSLAIIAIALYATAPRWVRWLPGLLVFGVINSLLGLITHHAPTNPQAAVSVGVAGLLVVFYAVGCIVTYHYNATRLSALDRIALLTYLFCMIWPAFSRNDLAVVTPVIAWSVSIGTAGLIASFVAHRARVGSSTVPG